MYKYPVKELLSRRLPTLWSLLDCFSITRKEVFLVQIGANDGVTYDPFHTFGLASFNRETSMGLFKNGYIQQRAAEDGTPVPEDESQLITTEDVPTRSLGDLLSCHKV